MDINNISTNNFKGAFVLQPKTQQIREAIPDIVKKGRQIFHDVRSEGDIVIVTKDKYDKKVKDFIAREKVAFAYYPEINTSSGLDSEVPSGLRVLMRMKNNCVIRSLSLLDKFLTARTLHLSTQSEYIQNAIHTMRLNTNGARVQIDDKGMFFVRDEAKQRTINTSGFKNCMAYLHVKPDHIEYQDSRRVLVGKNGQEIIKEFETPKDMNVFSKAFNA